MSKGTNMVDEFIETADPCEQADECVQSRYRVLLFNCAKLKKDSYIDANVSENMIRVAGLYVQDTIIEHIIGSSLYDAIAAMIECGTINDPENSSYRILITDYLFPVFAYAIQSELLVPLHFKIRNAGVVMANPDSTTSSILSDIKYLDKQYAHKADYYTRRAIDFLKCNRKCFPEVEGCGCGWCTIPAYSAQPTTPLNLNPIHNPRRK